MPSGPPTPDRLAVRLIEAADTRSSIEALTSTAGAFDLDTAYAVSDAVLAERLRRGHTLVGAKVALTNAAKQQPMGTDEPVYGWLTSETALEVGQPLVCERFVRPRCEPEIAFVLGEDLSGAHVTPAEVRAATAAVFPALEIVDSHFSGRPFTLADLTADNASGAGLALGVTGTDPTGIDLRLTGLVLTKNGDVIATAAGAEVLGDPVASVAWLVRALARRGRGLAAGQVVLSGAFVAAVPVEPGDVVGVEIDRLGSLELRCV